VAYPPNRENRILSSCMVAAIAGSGCCLLYSFIFLGLLLSYPKKQGTSIGELMHTSVFLLFGIFFILAITTSIIVWISIIVIVCCRHFKCRQWITSKINQFRHSQDRRYHHLERRCNQCDQKLPSGEAMCPTCDYQFDDLTMEWMSVGGGNSDLV
jgi:hypothetical protein